MKQISEAINNYKPTPTKVETPKAGQTKETPAKNTTGVTSTKKNITQQTTPRRRRRYLDETRPVRSKRVNQGKALTVKAPEISREEVLEPVTKTIAPSIAQVPITSPTVISAVNQILRSEDYDDLYKLRQQYKCGGRIRRK